MDDLSNLICKVSMIEMHDVMKQEVVMDENNCIWFMTTDGEVLQAIVEL